MSGPGWCGQSAFIPRKSKSVKAEDKSMGALKDVLKQVRMKVKKAREDKCAVVEVGKKRKREIGEGLGDVGVIERKEKRWKTAEGWEEKEEVKPPSEDSQIEMVKLKLQQKARLYDQLILSGGGKNQTQDKEDEGEGDYLVNFEEKQEETLNQQQSAGLNDEFHKYKIKKKK
uniref:Uncharacterized protein n=1 Tax=Euplotes harpa TaxID=151035 RepID=A0A7S3J5J3_9SPIT|mmetsp:Transcript_21061/g.24294  ORF Transcript_21061/g.24294 Transcript_21061/m.24294 type:complete len:172 (+) Transcript_21061:26-541(+)|eukprot:CAMPEP_0168337218 /NCGR_PEP_ID=MMETSP0213-20121227/12033_1 /TAXON_ID=151035 /ORGANISM="Euplotes harpa, Strain FSP1.4" /LENGTH=171 /DNA_ID=CAMNT_0008342613 /DNA_START=12 /DNA_END=527 /DNA_ORIENTATION=+